MENELKIKILSNSNGEKVSLDNISIDAADALKVFIESLSDFAKNYDTSGIKLSLNNGSIETVFSFPAEDTEILTDINNILEGKSFSAHKTKLFKNIQDKIRANGLGYHVSLNENNIEKDLTQDFIINNFPLRRGARIPFKFEILFLNGKTYKAGGDVTSKAYVEIENKKYKIDCTKADVNAMGPVYSDVYLAVLKKWKNEEDIDYKLIDNYHTENVYSYFKNIHDEFKKKDSLEKYDYLHDKVVQILEDENIHTNNIIKLLRLYNNQYSDKDRGILRTLLMSIKPILKENDELSYYYNEVAKRFKYGSKSKKI